LVQNTLTAGTITQINMVNFDWTKIERPRFDDGKIFWAYEVVNLNSATISQDQKNSFIESGLMELLDYYGKTPPSSMRRLTTVSDRFYEIYFNPSSACYSAKVLIAIRKDDLDALSDRGYNTAALQIVNTTVKEFEDNVNSITQFLDQAKLYTELQDEYLHIDGFIQRLTNPIKEFKTYPGSISDRALENDVLYLPQSQQSLKILYNNDNQFVGVVLDNESLIVGFDGAYNRRRISFNSKFANNFVLQHQNASADARARVSSRARDDWQQYFFDYIKYGDVSFAPSDTNNIKFKDVALGTAKAVYESSDLPYLINSKRNFVISEIDRFKSIPENAFTLKCSPLTAGEIKDEAYRIAKIRSKKDAEDAILGSNLYRATLRDFDVVDYVGDAIFDDLDNLLGSAPTSIEGAFTNVLNYVGVDTLVNAALRCLLVQGEVPELWKICIDIYKPPTIKFPDGIKIPNLFDFISKLIVKVLLLALQAVLLAILKLILQKLRDCINGTLEDFNERKTASDYFGDGLSDADAYIAEKVFGNADSLGAAGPLTGDDAGNLLDDIANALTPQEFCALITGSASDEVYKIVLCLIATRYPTIYESVNTFEKIQAVFEALSGLLNTDACVIKNVIPIPADASLCLTSDHQTLRKNLLQDKFSDINEATLQEQLDAAEDRRQHEMNTLKSLLESDSPFEDALLDGQSMEDYIQDLIPCAKDNEPMKHIIKMSIDTTLNPMSTFFNQAMLNKDLGFQRSMMNPEREEIRNEMNNSGFIDIKENGFDLSGGASGVRYRFLGNSVETGIFADQIEVTKTDNLPAEAVQNSISNVRKQLMLDLFEDPINISEYDDIMRIMIESIIDDITRSSFNTVNSEQIAGIFGNIVTDDGKSLLYENCWVNSESVRKGMLELYLDEDCKKKDSKLYDKVLLAGMVRLYIRTLMVEYYFKNYAIVSQFFSEDFQDSFIKDFLSQKVGFLLSTIDANDYIEDLDSLISEQMNSVFVAFRGYFQGFLNPDMDLDGNNIKNYFFDKLQVFQSDPDIIDSKMFYLKIDQQNDTSISGLNQVTMKLSLKYITVPGQFPSSITFESAQRTVNLIDFDLDAFQSVLEDLTETLKQRRKTELLFDFAFPTKDALAALSLFIFIRIRNNLFDQLFNLNKNVIVNIENIDDFTFENKTFQESATKDNIKSLKKDDRKSSIERILN